RVQLWPHQSLSPHGFVVFVGLTAIFLAIPLVGLLGTPALWWVLFPFVLTLAALWMSLRKNWNDRRIVEELSIWPDRIELVRQSHRHPTQRWAANPMWVRVALHENVGPVPYYVTLTGAGREVEIGSFLSEDERKSLYSDLNETLRKLRL
ncbi:MAG: DUF2244 domain-containing protein, partial [Pseudomonadota bacterium]